MEWRLGLDIGTNSIGWWAFRLAREDAGKNAPLRPVVSLDGGSYIFPDGREPSKGGRVGDSLAVSRRLARSMRRNRDRGKNRIRFYVQELISLGLLPADKEARDKLFQTPKGTTSETDAFNPYRLRAEALDRPLNKYELGRALLHLGLRRGYKSNRKEFSDEDGGKLKEHIDKLKDRMGQAGYRTLGEYLWKTYLEEHGRENAKGIRFRAEGDFYPERSMYQEEFNAIRKKQENKHDLSGSDWDGILEKHILFQWPLKPVERGRCEFFLDEYRHWQDTPIGHDYRIYQELNNLEWRDEDYVSHRLDKEQWDAVLALLMKRKSEVKFSALRKEKRSDGSPLFPKDSTFNLEDPKRKGLKAHKIAASCQDDPSLKFLWKARETGDNGRLDDIFDILHEATDNDEATKNLINLGLDEDVVKNLCALSLADGTSRVSRKFMEKIVPVMRDQGLIYSEAVSEITDDDGQPLHHSLRDDGKRWPQLPYYGEVMPGSMLGSDRQCDPRAEPEKHFGKINNPTVHVALNSLRRLVNALIDRFGCPPLEIHVELTRDLKLPRKVRDEITKKQADNQKDNERIKKMCAEFGIHDPRARDIKKVKLWEELGEGQLARQCVYSGENISANMLFNGEVEIEHILPFSRTLDDSMSNMTISTRKANRLKVNKTPYEAFGADAYSGEGIVWKEVLKRAANLPVSKRWRFEPTAMERFDEKNSGFIARQLNDTAYITRVAQRYLEALDGVDQVVANPGRLTAMVRGKWDFNNILGENNEKTRDDHRHHAVDAAVVALIDRRVLNKVSTARAADDRVHIEIPDLDEQLRGAIYERMPQIITAFKPNHGTQGRMFNETAYGFVPEKRIDPALPEHNLVSRKTLADLTPKQCKAIRDPDRRNAVLEYLKEAESDGLKHKDALAAYVKETGVRKVRVLDKNKSVKKVSSAPYKGYSVGEYACFDIWRLPLDKKEKKPKQKWLGVPWTYADCRGKMPDKVVKSPHPAAKFVVRLFKGDIVSYKEGSESFIKRVVRFQNQQIVLRDPEDASDLNEREIQPMMGTLCAKGLRRLFVTPDGRILNRRQGGA